jgi:hypothetical protein
MAKKKSKPDITVSITEITVTGGKKKNIRLNVDGQNVNVPVDEAVYAHWQEQFVRASPTPAQRKRFSTFMNVVRAAYQKGLKDA